MATSRAAGQYYLFFLFVLSILTAEIFHVRAFSFWFFWLSVYILMYGSILRNFLVVSMILLSKIRLFSFGLQFYTQLRENRLLPRKCAPSSTVSSLTIRWDSGQRLVLLNANSISNRYDFLKCFIRSYVYFEHHWRIRNDHVDDLWDGVLQKLQDYLLFFLLQFLLNGVCLRNICLSFTQFFNLAKYSDF